MPSSVVTTELAARLKVLPPYLFVRIDTLKKAMIAKGIDVIDFGIGDPDTATPGAVVEACAAAAHDPANHKYPSNWGMPAFREAAAMWMRDHYGVTCDPAKEILSLLGTKEAIGHIPLAFVNPEDVVLITDPGYPVYRSATALAGATPYFIPLREANGFLPDYGTVPSDVARRARLMYINYPNNPTAAVADKAFFERTVEFARANDIIVVHDAAYLEIAYDGYTPQSFLAVEGAMEVGVEFHSLSKTFNMAGWRTGWAAGNADVLAGLAKVKSNLDSGMFQAVQLASVEALSGRLASWHAELIALYTKRRDILCDGLNAVGWKVAKPRASFYVWARVPEGMTSDQTATELLEHGGVVVIPGTGYGENGEGYIRMSITLDAARIEEGVRRIREVVKRWQGT
ncbi:MAG: LL-diaminopimelate aminotransferase [Verrucomicrobia bacterium]|nr:LL-diaminopimelate aminotransferase [Verrucomicrobiota bacterium]